MAHIFRIMRNRVEESYGPLKFGVPIEFQRQQQQRNCFTVATSSAREWRRNHIIHSLVRIRDVYPYLFFGQCLITLNFILVSWECKSVNVDLLLSSIKVNSLVAIHLFQLILTPHDISLWLL